MAKDHCLAPSVSLLCKLGSLIVHCEEGYGSDGHVFDTIAIKQLMEDSEVRNWMAEMRKMALLPVMRKG